MANNTNNNLNTADNQNPTTDFIPYTAFNTTLTQGLNPGDYYGIGQGEECNVQGCVPNVISQDKFLIPSLQQVAEYNLESLYGNNPEFLPIENNNRVVDNRQIQNIQAQNRPVPTNSPATSNNMMQQNTGNMNALPDTPANVFSSGATLGSTATNTMGIEITDFQNPYPVTPESLQYLNGFIRTQIGRRVSIDFLVGSNTMVTKLGYLLGVASNYILINELDTNDITTCDFYNIKFIRFFY